MSRLSCDYISTYSSFSKRVLLVHEGLDTIYHILHKLLLGFAESSLVRDVEDAVVGLSVLTMDASDLNFVLVGDLVEGGFVGHELWQLDVD